MTDSKTATELLCNLLDEFEHECFMIRVEASETRAKHEVVRKAYERQRDETAQAIVATLGSDREAYDAGFENGVKAILHQLDGLLMNTDSAVEIQAWVDEQWGES